MGKTEKKAEKAAKKKMKVSQVVGIYNIIKTFKVARLPKEIQFKIIRNARALRATATGFEDFLADARERLKPEGFDSILEKSQRFKELSDEEKLEVNEAIAKYNRDVEECVHTELDKIVEIEGLERLEAETLISDDNDHSVETLLMLEEL